MRFVLLLLPVLFLAACAGGESLKELRSVQPQGTPFNKAISAEYLKLAEYKEQQEDWMGSQYYADKGLRAAYGSTVNVDPIPPQTDIGMDRYAELTHGLEIYNRYANETAQSTQTAIAARAHVLFDCWIGEVAKHANQQDIEYCEVEFYKAVQYIKDGGQPAKSPMVSTSYLLFFDWDSTNLTADAMSKVKQLISDIRQMGNVEVTINGHTDRSGEESYNLELSQHRAEAVRNLLTGGGIAQAIISIFAFGESDPAVPTADGVKEQRNRRVEVFVE